MENLSDIRTVRTVMEKHGVSFSKALGQNFIINPSVCPKMADLCGTDENTGVIEIGGGVGVLTNELCKRSKKVVCVELDTRLLPVLADTLSEYDNFECVNADIMKIDLHELIRAKFGDMRVVVCANLPYYITSPILTMLLEGHYPIDSITVMVQKEAADRLCTPVGSRDSGAITICTNYFATAKQLFNVSRGSFMPAPNVDSTVIKLDIRKEPAVKVDEKKFFRMVRAAFSQRRKTLVNSLNSGLSLSKDELYAVLDEAGIDRNVRPEKLSMDELATICNLLP